MAAASGRSRAWRRTMSARLALVMTPPDSDRSATRHLRPGQIFVGAGVPRQAEHPFPEDVPADVGGAAADGASAGREESLGEVGIVALLEGGAAHGRWTHHVVVVDQHALVAE